MLSADRDIRLELLGPVRAWRHGQEVNLGPPKQRAVLGLLASRVNGVVGVEQIVDAVWGSDVPQTGTNGVHTYVAGLRRVLEPGRSRRETGAVLVSAPGGYSLRMDPDAVDVELFVRRHARARRLRADGDVHGALDVLDSALALWRGEAYYRVPGPFAVVERTRLQDLRLTAIEEWGADMLAVGRHAEAIAGLTDAIVGEPLHEKLRWLLMLALYRCGRQAHALQVYRETRKLLSEELGIEPRPELRELHEQILAGDPALDVPEQRRPPVSAAETGGSGLWHAVRPAQLPAAARGFVGRTRELHQLRTLITADSGARMPTATVAVVAGAAGVGKSALVLELAHQLTDRFPDGQLFVDLCGANPAQAPLTAGEALELLLRSLGVGESRLPADLAGRAALYRSILNDKRVLIVLDDAVNAEQLRPLIPRGASCVLVTSRRRQNGLAARDGAHHVQLGPLAPDESLDLLGYLLDADRVRAEREAVATIARLCCHLPLALRIAAEAFAANPGVSLAQLSAQFEDRCSRLDRFAVEGDSAACLRTAFTMSYRALSEPAARLFRLLGLQEDCQVTVPTAAALLDCDHAQAVRHLEALVDSYLLEDAGHGGYRLPDLVRIYAAERAEDEPVAHRAAALSRLMRLRDAGPDEAGPAEESSTRHWVVCVPMWQ